MRGPSSPPSCRRAGRAALALIASLAVLAPAASRGEEPGFADSLGTLDLAEALDSRGALGGVTMDALGFLYVANFRDKVWRIDPATGAVRLVSDALYGASGNAVGPLGELYQASFNAGTVTRFSRAGKAIVVAEGLDGPVGIAVGRGGELYVAECRGNTIARVDPSGAVDTFAESELFACPNGLALGDDGHLYVASFNRLELARIDPDGNVEAFATVPGAPGNAHLVFARGLLFVTKILTNQVVKVAMTGEVLPVAGSGQEGHDDGPGPAATLSKPNGIAVSPAGDRLYVNTLEGAYRQPAPSTIRVRTIELLTLSSLFEEALERGGAEEATRTYERFKADPVRRLEHTAAEMIGLGYNLLSSRRVAEALAAFRLNADSYPDSVAAQFALAEAFRYTGRPEQAAARYRQVLELDPDNPQAAARLRQVAPDEDG